MTYDPALLDALDQIAPVEWAGEAFRFTTGARPPDRENIDGARWNPRDVPTIYTALDRATLEAEFKHALGVWNPQPDPSRFTAHRLRVAVSGIVDLRSNDALTQVGLDANDLANYPFEACQHVGGAAHWLGRGGLLVPSARQRGGTNLVIFTNRQTVDYEFEALDSSPMG